MKVFYNVIGIMALAGGGVTTYALKEIPTDDSNFLTFAGLLIAFVSILLSVLSVYQGNIEKERNDIELAKLTIAINELKSSIEENNKKIDNKISNVNNKFHSTKQNNTYSLLTIDLNSKKDLKRK